MSRELLGPYSGGSKEREGATLESELEKPRFLAGRAEARGREGEKAGVGGRRGERGV